MGYVQTSAHTITFGKYLNLAINGKPETFIQLADPQYDVETLKNYTFGKCQEKDGKPTITTKIDATKYWSAFPSTNWQNFIREKKIAETGEVYTTFNGDMTDVDEYVFVPTQTDFVCGFGHNQHGLYGMEQYSNMFERPQVYARKTDGTFTQITGNWVRYTTPTYDAYDRWNWDYAGWGNWDWTQYILDNVIIPIESQSVTVSQNAQLFTSAKWCTSPNSARRYLIDGDESGIIDGGESEEVVGVDREYKLYYYADIYKTQFSHRKPSTKIGREKFEFIVKMRDKDGNAINKYNRGVIGWVDESNADGRKNLRFMKNTATNNYLYANVDGTKIENFDFTKSYTTYTKNFKPDNDINYYYANIQTNMYIFDTLSNAQDFLDGLNDKLIGILEDFSQIDNTTDTVMNDNDVASDTNMSNAYILSKVDLHLLAKAFNVQVNNGNIVQSLFVGLSIYQNPIDCNIDLFGLPFEVSEFTDYTPETIDFNPIIGNTTPTTS